MRKLKSILSKIHYNKLNFDNFNEFFMVFGGH